MDRKISGAESLGEGTAGSNVRWGVRNKSPRTLAQGGCFPDTHNVVGQENSEMGVVKVCGECWVSVYVEGGIMVVVVVEIWRSFPAKSTTHRRFGVVRPSHFVAKWGQIR